MQHSISFNEKDPELKKLRKLCLAFPGASEKISHGRPYFYTKKTFAIFGATIKGDQSSDIYEQSMVFQPNPEEAEPLKQDKRFFVPAYWGAWGWLGTYLDDKTDWEEIAELVDESYRLTAIKKLINQLDEN